MSQLFSTERLPASDRIDAWQWNAQQICGDCRIQLPKNRFHGSIEKRRVGDLSLTRFSSSPLSFWKWPADSVTGENRSCIVITQIAGARCYLQNGAEIVLRPGDSTVIDSARPWSSSCATDCVRLYLRVPRSAMEEKLQMREIPIAKRICGGTVAGRTLSSLMQSLYDEAEWMQEEETSAALDSFFEALARDKGSLPKPPELSGRIFQYVDAHISEPTLGPCEVASAMGISVRHVHRVFSASGMTMGDYVRLRRLEQCRDDLANPRLREKTITEIAFCRGFSDAAHFSHLFRKKFGISARLFRAQGIGREHASRTDAAASLIYPNVAGIRDLRLN
jgi:AraC family transcriptional regulator, positive regulator of tynA and feaB